MLTTIEQKLSAIKAINESKDQIEAAISELSTITEPNTQLLSESARKQVREIQENADQQIREVALQDYLQQKADLISKAEGLMK